MEQPILSYTEFDEILVKLNEIHELDKKQSTIMGELTETTGGLTNARSFDLIVNLLETIFEDNINNWISYFMYDLEWGALWKPGAITDEDGSDIRLDSTKDLYKLITKKEEE